MLGLFGCRLGLPHKAIGSGPPSRGVVNESDTRPCGLTATTRRSDLAWVGQQACLWAVGAGCMRSAARGHCCDGVGSGRSGIGADAAAGAGGAGCSGRDSAPGWGTAPAGRRWPMAATACNWLRAWRRLFDVPYSFCGGIPTPATTPCRRQRVLRSLTASAAQVNRLQHCRHSRLASASVCDSDH